MDITLSKIKSLGFVERRDDYSMKLFKAPNGNREILYRHNRGCKGVTYSTGSNDSEVLFNTIVEIKEYFNIK
jgi:hypothetical protein